VKMSTQRHRSNEPAPVGTMPLVSVLMITYNHDQFIAQAVESVLMQKTGFPIELVIGEDCSTDRTRDIVSDFQRRCPQVIRALLPPKNLGMHRNFVETLAACTGKYVAVLEGDDYWTDPNKLQKQVEFLEANPDYSACFTRTKVVSECALPGDFCLPSDTEKLTYTTEDLINSNAIGMATGSMMFRNVIDKSRFDPFLSLFTLDWPLQVMLSQVGPIGYLNEVMAAYRQHDGGVWSGRDEMHKLTARLKFYCVIKQVLPSIYAQMLNQRIVKMHQLRALELLRQGDRRSSRLCTLKSLRAIPLTRLFGFRWYLKRSAILLLGTFILPLPKVERLLRA